MTGLATTSEFTLRLAVPGDENALSLVGAASFLEAFAGILNGPDILEHCRKQNSPEKYRSWLQSSDAYCCVAEVKQAPVGYAVLCPPDLPIETTADDIELKRIYLLHRFQGQGLGAALMNWAVNHAASLGKRRLLLGVYAGNEKALKFYERCAFQRAGRRQFQVGSMSCEDVLLGRDLARG